MGISHFHLFFGNHKTDLNQTSEIHWMVIYKIFVFGADRKSNMAARAHNVF